jgi:small subunit ribosomal protein S17
MSDPSPDAGASEAAAPEELAAEPEGGILAEATDASGAVTEAAPDESTTPAPAAPAATSAPAPAREPKPAQTTAAAEGPRANRRKVREGVVSSSSMDKTAVVKVVERVRHPRYFRTVQRTKKLYVHVETEELKVGDRVRVVETRPLSKLKHWRLLEVLERAK